MNDIIKEAQQLLDGATPAPWVTGGTDESGNIYIGNPSEYGNLVATSGICDADLIAAAPELAQALAEETWEYQVQARSMKRPAWKPSTNSILQKWYGAEDIEEAKSQARMYTPYFRGREKVEIRVLRRRVSPPEVME